MSVGFSRLQVSGYRRLKKLDLELRPLNVLIGANGVGKSSILEVMSLLAASADGRLKSAVSEVGGFEGLITADSRISEIGFALEKDFAEIPRVKYELKLSRGAIGGYILMRELLADRPFNDPGPEKIWNRLFESDGENLNGRIVGEGIIKIMGSPKNGETVLSQLPRNQHEGELLRNLLAASNAVYHPIDTSRRAPIRLPQPVQPAQTPGTDGSLLVGSLYNMRENEPDRFEAVEDALRAAFPTFERLLFPAVASGVLSLNWRERDFKNAFYPSQLSDGTLRFLWLTTLLQSRELGAVTMIDEPEVSLHPEMLRILADLMREASQRTQLIVATHSDRFVRFLEPDELVVCDIAEDGGMEAKRGSELDLDEWLKDYTLDQLWSMGRLGGRS
jgi:predicted ATPase